jgi:diguanylate cyclase (GGDEF)-like protein
VTKPFDAQELRVRLRAGERICALQVELVAARESLRYEATHDHLTGAWNRAAILDALERERARAARANTALAVAMVDFDHFKRVNDVYGHLAGDAVLRDGVARITASLRARDFVGRYGGEEFLVVMPDCDGAAAMSVCERVRAAVAGEPIALGALRIPATVSIGAAAWTGSHDPSELVDRADAALYRAKHGGRDRVELATDTADRASAVELVAAAR